MSRNVLERVLHQLTVDRAAKQRFREDAAAYLQRFALSEAERAMLTGFDVLGLQQAGVNPMLTMGFWQELSPERDMRAYMRKLRPLGAHEPVHSAALKP
ncbi:extradiol ring-cleavage dioxygenase [Cupriavidus sp. USMAHM13]|uniref:Extradiol ring-cleavage dioxygenase n=1 Tax=Cupriavidus malaysiensis TaxID=367825 RepID=A0ABM6FEM3_9BURK|nr:MULTISPECIES: extradiol ring-cleavage dioxygenase [Cupriavidus]AOZ02292.1 extradiol ring-cleavage dioxygenase [Cupriavidus sp. USMAHM13]AOZ10329.1 extradiol ring-cleavage dioxygenase [Cupriavidus malaysiensis]